MTEGPRRTKAETEAAALARQRTAVSEYVEWATEGQGLADADLAAAAHELDELDQAAAYAATLEALRAELRWRE